VGEHIVVRPGCIRAHQASDAALSFTSRLAGNAFGRPSPGGVRL